VKTKRRVNLYVCGFQNKERNAHQKADLFHKKKKKETIFHEFNTNKPDFIASTGWKDFWKNFTVCGSSPSVKKKYRQIQNHFRNLQKKFSVLCKMKVHLIQTSNTDRPAWTAKCCYPTIASHEEKSARRYIWSRQLSDCCIVSQVSMLQTDFMGISKKKKSCLQKYSSNSTSC
jgi:hypothetical protein